jgi:cyclic pyranopterin phosphate synthase
MCAPSLIADLERDDNMSEFTHFNSNGDAVMVDVSQKTDTVREATAKGKISMSRECFDLVVSGGMGKGDVLGVARIAGIMGAKKTSELIPLCHILNLTKVELDFETDEDGCCIVASCTAKTLGNMCKAVDKAMRIEDIHLCKKSGGKSGLWEACDEG